MLTKLQRVGGLFDSRDVGMIEWILDKMAGVLVA